MKVKRSPGRNAGVPPLAWERPAPGERRLDHSRKSPRSTENKGQLAGAEPA